MNIRVVLFATALVAALPSAAATVRLTGFEYAPASSVTVSAPSYSGRAGSFVGTLDGNAFTTFCMDLLQSFAFNTNYTYSIVDGVTAWGAQRSLAIDRVISFAYASGLPNNAATSAAIQSALWEVLYEANPSYGFSTGTFRASSSGATQTALNALNFATIMSTPITHHADQLFNAQRQDFLVVSRVPEPDSSALFGLGVLGIVALARVRSRRPR